MLLSWLIPDLPRTTFEFFVFGASICGGLMLVYSQFVERENRRDLIRMIGAIGLLAYAIYITNVLFAAVMLGIFGAALVEFIEIYLGVHKHTR